MTDPKSLLQQLKIDRTAPSRRVRRWPWLVAAIAVVAIVWAIGSGRPIEVEVASARAAAESGPISVLDASGYVTARRLATVSSKITGKVREVHIEEGQRVEAGQVLAYLDDVDAQAQLALSQAQADAARAQLGEVEANLALAERTLARQRSLVAQRLVAQSALDQAQAEHDALVARRTSVRRQIDSAERGLEVARIGVENTVIRAPFAGIVIAKAAQPGEMISPISAGGGFTRTGIGTIVDMDSLEVEVDVNEAYIGRVQPGQPVESVLNAYPEWRIPGRVIAIIPAADRSKATVRVRIGLDSDDRRIVPDMGVRVSFLDEPDPNAAALTGAWVPSRAIVGNGPDTSVFVIEEGRVRRVAIDPGPERDSDRLARSGLSGGETVVLSPPDGLEDGDPVRSQAPRSP